MALVEGLRNVVRAANFAVFGVPATVAGVATRIIWVSPATELQPADNDFRRAEPKRTMAIRRDEVPEVPIGTLVSVTEHGQTFPALWRVDAMDDVQPTHHQVVVVPA